MISRWLRVYGHVQGVWYHESMRQRAEDLKITGWVRNRSDGTVEAVVQGDECNVEQLIEWARRGSPAARVERVDVEVVDAEPALDSFEKKPTI